MFSNKAPVAAMFNKVSSNLVTGLALAALAGAGFAPSAEAFLPVPSLTISDAEGYETCPAANPAVEHPVFIVRLIRPATGPFVTETVQFTTQNGTAIAGQDYVAKSGTLTFLPNETTKTIQVNLITDSNGTAESVNQNFSVVLSNPSIRLRNNDMSGVATVIDLDPSAEECQRRPDVPVDEPNSSPCAPGDVECECKEQGIRCF